MLSSAALDIYIFCYVSLPRNAPLQKQSGISAGAAHNLILSFLCESGKKKTFFFDHIKLSQCGSSSLLQTQQHPFDLDAFLNNKEHHPAGGRTLKRSPHHQMQPCLSKKKPPKTLTNESVNLFVILCISLSVHCCQRQVYAHTQIWRSRIVPIVCCHLLCISVLLLFKQLVIIVPMMTIVPSNLTIRVRTFAKVSLIGLNGQVNCSMRCCEALVSCVKVQSKVVPAEGFTE